ncbi:hypothetical protein NCC49_003603 [Naganishia albida]|nr:hypothetical protein NCC49_003603 [Naganishia albida]
MSFASTAPSLQLQTPGLQQEAFPFPQSSLGVSVEEYDEGDTDDGHRALRIGHHDGHGGSDGKQTAAVSMVAERRRQFEAQKHVVASQANRKERSIRSYTPTKGSDGSTVASVTVERVATQDITSADPRISVEVKDYGFTESPISDPTGGIGLGLQGLTKTSESANSWQDDMVQLEQSLREAADSFTSLGSPGHGK